MFDFLRKTLINISAVQLDPERNDENNSQGLVDFEDFLNNENSLILFAFLTNQGLTFSNTINNEQYDKVIIFTKKTTMSAATGDESFMKNLQINTISGSPIVALYESLTYVFSPFLQMNKDSPILNNKLAMLQIDLRNIILTENPKYLDNLKPMVTDYGSIENEIIYWQTYKSIDNKYSEKAVENFVKLLKPIAKDLNLIEVLQSNDVEDVLEHCHNALDDLWRLQPPFPNQRMKYLMDSISFYLWRHIFNKFKSSNIWNDDYNTISDKLQQSIALGEKWLNNCHQLTALFWSNLSSHSWKEAPYQPPSFVQFLLTLKEVHKIRTVHIQLMKLSTSEEQSNFDNFIIFQPFQSCDVLQYETSENNEFQKALKMFETLLEPVEKQIALKLKSQFIAIDKNTRQLIYEFTHYAELISRPVIKTVLHSERKFLLNYLREYILEIQSQANTGTSKIQIKQETSETVKEIIFIRQLEVKVVEVVFLVETLLNDLDDSNQMTEFVRDVLNEIKSQQNELLDSWSSDIIANINNNSLCLKETDPVVKFSKDKLMKVNYSSKLNTLIAEVRQLKAMGYRISSIIEETADKAKKFMVNARILEQVANFHNTIGNRMIPSQKPMMLASALELSKLVQEEKVVSWDDEKSIEKYVNILKCAIEKLTKNNNMLTSHHIEIVDKIRNLEHVSLLKDFQFWKTTVKEIKNIVQLVENRGFKHMQMWKLDIDTKLSESLEKQYIKNLNYLHLNLQEIHVDLVYRNSVLEFSPNKDQLIDIYENQLKKYLDIPKTFRGICDSTDPSIYTKIIEKNEELFDSVEGEKNKLFQQLDLVIKHWQSWIQFDHLDVKKLTGATSWDLHFRASKTFGQEIAKLPSSEEKVGCFLIGLSRFRADLESHNRNYWDQLVYSLKDSIAEDVIQVQNYIDSSTSVLTKQPLTWEAIDETGDNFTQITSVYSERESDFNEMMEKANVLASWSREQVDSVKRLKTAWDRLGNLIKNYEHIMAKQIDTMKATLNVENENIHKKIEHFKAKWAQIESIQATYEINQQQTIEDIQNHYRKMKEKRADWLTILEKRNNLIKNYIKFNLDVPEILAIVEVEKMFEKEESTWSSFEEFDYEFVQINKEYWLVFRKRISQFEDFIKKWKKIFQSNNQLEFVNILLQEMNYFENILPTLNYLKGENFSEKHWDDVFKILKIEPKPIDELIFQDFLLNRKYIKDKSKELQAISKEAAREIVIRQALKDIDQWELQAAFNLYHYQNHMGKTVMLIKEFNELITAIGDHQIVLQSLKSSTMFDAFAKKAINWEEKLEFLNCAINCLIHIQKRWLYLEPIFNSGTLTQEKTRFDHLDQNFQRVMKYVEKNQRVTDLCRYPNLQAILQNILEQLTKCQHSLDIFLKEKRQIFPRFLFLRDEDLLEMIGQGPKEQVMQAHLKKLFSGVHSVEMDEKKEQIIAMCSLQGEIVQLGKPISIKRPVEEWLGCLVAEMQSTLRNLLIECKKENHTVDPLKYPSQILCLSNNIIFTSKCEQAINNMTLPTLLVQYKTQLTEYSSLEINNSSSTNCDSQILELKVKALLLDTVQHIDVLEELLNQTVTKITDWIWQKQLRFYFNSINGDVTIKQAKAVIDYSFEYIGNEPKLVRTPLIERCFLTLTQAMHLGLGGNPYGPAGTGKTESVKALGSILGRSVLVFNCDERIDISSMGRILKGLVKTGAWGCFDEFNRLDEATLSTITLLIHSIQNSLRHNLKMVEITDEEIEINKNCGIFITLNPANDDYGGRNELPDNLKQLFRPIIMTHPDQEQIARTLFHCNGYRYSNVIAKKLVEVFSILKKLTSKQSHYDWGLRIMKTVISSCENAIKQFKISNNGPLSITDEFEIVLNILRMNVVSKLTYSDCKKFNKVIQHVFKDMKDMTVEQMNDKKLEKIIEECCSELKLIINKRQVIKCTEFYNQLKQRMGVAIIGPPKSGKSTILKITEKVMAKTNYKLKIYPVNPKSMSKSLLLGHTDHLNQWNDGVLTNYSSLVSSESSNDLWSWILCDGDLDPDWVESLNSVLDDNRLMTLSSGWRIHFGPNVNFIFETDNLKNASPATISRLGIIYLSTEDVCLNEYVKRYLLNVENEEKRCFMEPLINDFLFKGIEWITQIAELTIPRSSISLVETVLLHLSEADAVKTKTEFTVKLINGLSQQLQQDFQEPFAQQMFEWTQELLPNNLTRMYYDKDKQLIDNHRTNANLEINLQPQDGVPLILTGQILHYLDAIKLWLEADGEHFLLAGTHGSAKRLLFQYALKNRSNVNIVTIHCSANLSTNFIIQQIQQCCVLINTFKGKVLRPKNGHLFIYLRNMDLLKPDKWGTHMVVEFLNQLIDFNGFFDINTPEFIGIEHFTIVATLTRCNRKLSRRFLSRLHLLNVDEPERNDLSTIVVTYLNAIIKTYFGPVHFPKIKVAKYAAAVLSIYEKIKHSLGFNNRQQQTRKNFPISLHDLTRWCSHLKYYDYHKENDFEVFLQEVICYEAMKLFNERFANEHTKKQIHTIFDEVYQSTWNIASIIKNISNLYYLIANRGNDKKTVWENVTKDNFSSMITSELEQLEKNNDGTIILHDELLLLLTTILRVATIPRYHLLLIGKTGLGRKTALKISAKHVAAQLIHPVTGNYPLFHNDLKMAIQLAGLENEKVFIILEDHIFHYAINSTLVNLLVTNGIILNLFTTTELDTLFNSLKEKMDNDSFNMDFCNLFASNVKKNLHVFVCLDDNNNEISNIIRDCPALPQNCEIFWMNEWSSSTMKTFPSKYVASLNQSEQIIECNDFQAICKHIPNDDISPAKYIALIKLYNQLYNEETQNINLQISTLKTGVAKLTETKDSVKEMRHKAIEQQKMLEEKQMKANAALDMISNTMKGASADKEEMKVLRERTENENIVLNKRKAEIEQELAEVEPLIQEARSAVGNIKTESLSEVRSLRAPPEIIRDILEGVLRLMGTQDTSWNSMKMFLAKRGVKEEIRSFNAHRIQTENRQAVEKLIATKKDSFNPKSAMRASVAAAPLAAWVEANVKYAKVLDKIRPLEIEQHKLKQNLENAQLQLNELSTGLLNVDQQVAKLKQQLSLYTKEAAKIEIDLNQANEILKSAEELIFKLEDEYVRWKNQLMELSAKLKQLSINTLLAAGFITFLPEKLNALRKEIMEKWIAELQVTLFDFITYFASEKEQIQWQTEGLNNDKFSIENVIILKKSILIPFIIDPTCTAIQWLKNNYKSNQNNFDSITINSSVFNTTLESSIRFGKTLLIEEMANLPDYLIPIIRKEFIHQGDRKMIKIFGKQIDYNDEFKLILCSRNEQIDFPSEMTPFLTIVNFNLTYHGFIERLLSVAVKQEKPELETKRKELLQKIEELQEQQQRLQNQLLQSLANASGNILNDKNLLATLNETKASSVAVSEALIEAKSIQATLRAEYEEFLEISMYGSRLYFVCNEFTKYNIFYSINSKTFYRLFLVSLQQMIEPNNRDVGLQKKSLFQSVYYFMARGVFKNDRLALLFHLVHSLYPKDIPNNETDVFFKNILYKNDYEISNLPEWIPALSISTFNHLKHSLPELIETCQIFETNLWSNFIKSAVCENEFPTHFQCTTFQKLLFIESLRPDRLLSSIEQCLLHISDLKTVDPPILSLHNIYNESKIEDPVILLITNTGSDPSSEIEDLAKEKCVKCEEIAMGEGQEETALHKLKECKKTGNWLIIKNLHLVTYWLPILAQHLKDLDGSNNFRLWLISKSINKFNFVLAYNALKIVYEEPPGIINNMLKIYSSPLANKYGNNLNNISCRLFFIYSCVHSILQERRNYIPQGWRKYYELNQTDIATCFNLTEDFWKNDTLGKIQWQSIKGILKETIYAGRIEIDDDINILDAYLRIYFNDEILSHKLKLFNLNINLPMSTQHNDYVKILKQYPKKDSATMFGLAENIEKSREKQMSIKLISNLKEFYLTQSTSTKTITEAQINFKELHSIFNLWKKINQGHDYIKHDDCQLPTSSHPNGQEQSAIETFISDEFHLGIHLIQTIHKLLMNLNRISKGLAEAEDEHLLIAKDLIYDKTPVQWLAIWNGPKQATQYLRIVLQKTNNITQWISEQNPMVKNLPVKLAQFFNPEAFLASIKLDFSRAENVSLEKLSLQIKWNDNNIDKNIDNNKTIILSNLLVEGGLFENQILKRCNNNSEIFSSVPNCYLNWIENDKFNENSRCFPLYTDSSRHQKIAHLQIDCSNLNDYDKWILNGLAFYLEY